MGKRKNLSSLGRQVFCRLGPNAGKVQEVAGSFLDRPGVIGIHCDRYSEARRVDPC